MRRQTEQHVTYFRRRKNIYPIIISFCKLIQIGHKCAGFAFS